MKRQEIIINGEKYIKLTGTIMKKANNAIFSEVIVKEEKEHEFEEVLEYPEEQSAEESKTINIL